jgi:hypothetical protein
MSLPLSYSASRLVPLPNEDAGYSNTGRRRLHEILYFMSVRWSAILTFLVMQTALVAVQPASFQFAQYHGQCQRECLQKSGSLSRKYDRR